MHFSISESREGSQLGAVLKPFCVVVTSPGPELSHPKNGDLRSRLKNVRRTKRKSGTRKEITWDNYYMIICFCHDVLILLWSEVTDWLDIFGYGRLGMVSPSLRPLQNQILHHSKRSETSNLVGPGLWRIPSKCWVRVAYYSNIQMSQVFCISI